MTKFKWTNYMPMLLFAAFIWGYSIFDAFFPVRAYSEMENRYLQQAPQFSVRTLFNNTYTIKFEEFTNDQFALRDSWITLKSLCETAFFKIENNGIVYGKDGYMFEKRVACDEEQLQKNLDSLLRFGEKFPDESVSLMLVPTSDMILTDKVPRGLHNVNQNPIIESVYENAKDAGLRAIDVRPVLREYSFTGEVNGHMHTAEYVYYSTDHHWTTFGAYLAYKGYADLLGRNSLPENGRMLWEIPGNEVPGFYGTYYSKCKLYSALPDKITWYDVPVKSVTINGKPADGIYDLEKFNARDKYAAFLHGNNGVTVIESDCGPGKDSGEKSSILVFKDSFGNSFAPFLCYSFDEITVVDLRYFNEVEKLVAEGDYDEILILYSFPSFAQETSLVNLKL